MPSTPTIAATLPATHSVPAPLEAGDVAPLLPRPAADADKYTRGVLAVVGGSSAYPGAPVLAALAAARSGAGYVRLIAPSGVAEVARTHLLSVPVMGCTQTACGAFDPECAGDVVCAASRADAFVVGPGLGTSSFVAEFLGKFFSALADAASSGDAHDLSGSAPVSADGAPACTPPLLLDADALNAIAANPDLAALHASLSSARTANPDVITPHAGEAARLLGRPLASEAAARTADAFELAEAHACVVVLKGPDTIVASPDGRARIICEGGPELAKAGTGDVLSGIIGAFAAQGLATFEAACAGVFVHARAARIASGRMGVGAVMPEDIIATIGKAVLSVEE